MNTKQEFEGREEEEEQRSTVLVTLNHEQTLEFYRLHPTSKQGSILKIEGHGGTEQLAPESLAEVDFNVLRRGLGKIKENPGGLVGQVVRVKMSEPQVSELLSLLSDLPSKTISGLRGHCATSSVEAESEVDLDFGVFVAGLQPISQP